MVCNRKYYLDNPKELENDLGIKVEGTNLNVENIIEVYKNQLVHNQLSILFSNEKYSILKPSQIILKDFLLIEGSSHFKCAVATHKDTYFIICDIFFKSILYDWW